jgi:hypothetical protein
LEVLNKPKDLNLKTSKIKIKKNKKETQKPKMLQIDRIR